MTTEERPAPLAGSTGRDAVPAPRPAPERPWHRAAGTTPTAASAEEPGADLQGRRAGFVTRAVANALDVGVVVLLLFAGYLGVAAIRFLARPASFRFPAPSLELVVVIGGLLLTVYFALAWTSVGRTYGDEDMGLRVVDRRGRRLRAGTAAARAVLCVVFPLGLLWVLVSPQNRALQDVALRTSAVYDWSRP